VLILIELKCLESTLAEVLILNQLRRGCRGASARPEPSVNRHRPVTKRYDEGRIIRVEGKARDGNEKRKDGLEWTENKMVTGVIRKLDKATLNLYTAPRIGLGAPEQANGRLALPGAQRA
jgi:hypothetical protein